MADACCADRGAEATQFDAEERSEGKREKSARTRQRPGGRSKGEKGGWLSAVKARPEVRQRQNRHRE